MQRISVVGSSGGGKTTIARRLTASLNVSYGELDAFFWGAGWSAASDEESCERVASEISGESWVVDGDCLRRLGTLVWDRADTVVWIDASRWRAMSQVLARTVRRAATRQELWNGNRETWRGLWIWRGDDSTIRWVWTTYPPTRDRYELVMRQAASGSGPHWHRLRSRRDANRFLLAHER